MPKKITDLHREAMSLADLADEERRKGRHRHSALLAAKAFDLESQAAMLLLQDFEQEPARSVLFRSAASLALEAGLTREAERFASLGLGGTPPEEVAHELRVVLENAGFERHLELRGFHLHPQDLAVSMTGPLVSSGLARSRDTFPRVVDTEKLLFRTGERLQKVKFRERGGPTRGLREEFDSFVSAPQVNSFAVVIRLGQQSRLAGLGLAQKTIAEFITCMDLVQSTPDASGLRKRIHDDAYFRNFVGLSRLLHPDGKSLDTVSFISDINGRRRSVTLRRTPTKPRNALKSRPQGKLDTEPSLDTVGTLQKADGKGKQFGKIQVVPEGQPGIEIHVPRGLLGDVVQPHFDTLVRVRATRTGTRWVLDSIDPQ